MPRRRGGDRREGPCGALPGGRAGRGAARGRNGGERPAHLGAGGLRRRPRGAGGVAAGGQAAHDRGGAPARFP